MSKMPSVCSRPRGFCLCLALLASMIMTVTSCRELFVRPTSSLRDCPGVPCLTLEKYAEMSDMFITSNIVLKLLPGRHVLTNTFIVQKIENFTIEGQIENESSSYPVIQYTAQNYSMARPALHFNNSFNITLRAVKFDYVINYHNLDTYGERIEYENASVVTFQHGNDFNMMYSNICMIWSNQDEMETHSSQPPFISGFGMEMAKNVNITNTEILGGDVGVITQDSTNIILSGVRVLNSSIAISINATENVTCNGVQIIESGNNQLKITNSDYITIQNLNVIKQTHVRGFRYFVRTHKSSHISILDSVIDSTYRVENRIRMDYGGFIYISNITARHFLFRIDLRHIQNVTITESEIGGIVMYGTDYVTVSHTSLLRPYEGFFARVMTYTYLYYVRSSEIHMNRARHQEIFHTSIRGRGIGIYNAEHTIISNTSVSNSRSEGLVLVNSHHTTISNATLSNTRDPGIHLINSHFTTVLYTSVSNTRQVGVRVEGAEHTTLSDITVAYAGVHGIILLDTAHTTIHDISVKYSNSNGIEVHNAINTTMSNVLVENSGLNGVELSHVNDTTISQVNVRNANWNGMQLRDTENVQISFTTVSNAQWIGIELCYSTLTSLLNTTVTGRHYRPNYFVTRECFKQCSYDPSLEVTCIY